MLFIEIFFYAFKAKKIINKFDDDFFSTMGFPRKIFPLRRSLSYIYLDLLIRFLCSEDSHASDKYFSSEFSLTLCVSKCFCNNSDLFLKTLSMWRKILNLNTLNNKTQFCDKDFMFWRVQTKDHCKMSWNSKCFFFLFWNKLEHHFCIENL